MPRIADADADVVAVVVVVVVVVVAAELYHGANHPTTPQVRQVAQRHLL
jgi:hypothetical protein